MHLPDEKEKEAEKTHLQDSAEARVCLVSNIELAVALTVQN